MHLEEELKRSYLDYAMSVIVGRALPDVRDGLKPVHRRILYAMTLGGNHWNRAYKKSARIVGDVMGKYHPHGDPAIYDTIVRMAQDFSMRHPLVDGQGNFGSIDGDAAAAMRYTEIRMTKLAHEMMADIDKDTVEFVPNYDGEETEPSVLPTLLPNLLVNGSSGIAVGMATNIPPHNLGEICDAVIATVENPEITMAELMRLVPGPDFPTAGFILGRDGIKQAYETGKGLVRVRARAHVEEYKKDREAIIVTEVPYQVNKANLITKIAELVREKRITGITDIRDESSREGIRVVLELSRGEIPDIILKSLYKFTEMETTFGVQLLAITNNQPKLFTLKGMIEAFIEHRKETILRRTRFDLARAKERAHILEGLTTALDHLDEVIALIRAAKTPDDARAGLMDHFRLSEIQAKAILDMRLQRLTGLERDKILAGVPGGPPPHPGAQRDPGERGQGQGHPLRGDAGPSRPSSPPPGSTQFMEAMGDITMEELIPDEEMVITVSHGGYIKRTGLVEYRSQHRGGQGQVGHGHARGRFRGAPLHRHQPRDLPLLHQQGQGLRPEGLRDPRGRARRPRGAPCVNLLSLEEGEKILGMLPTRGCFDEQHCLVMATREGLVKKTVMTEFASIRTNGKIAITFQEGDELVGAGVSDGDGPRLPRHAQRPVHRLPRGRGAAPRAARAWASSASACARATASWRWRSCAGAVVESSDEEGQGKAVAMEGDILTVTERGYGKRTPLGHYRIQGRGGYGVINIQVTAKNGPVVGGLHVHDRDEIMVITAGGQILRTPVKGISRVGRRTQGYKLITPNAGDTVAAIAQMIPEEVEAVKE